MRLKPTARRRTQKRYYERHFDISHSCESLKCEEHVDVNDDAWRDGTKK